MFLDDLFKQAAIDVTAAQVSVGATVATNQSGGWNSSQTTNIVGEHANISLGFTPGRTEIVKEFVVIVPAQFAGSGLIITAPGPGNGFSYEVEWQGNRFTLNSQNCGVAPNTNVVYGPAGQQFITISLCDYVKGSQ